MSIQSTNSHASRLVQFPFGEADVKSVTAAAAMEVEVNNTETIVEISEMGAAGTINLKVHGQMPVGARLTVRASADGTNRLLTFGTGMTGVAFSVTANKSATLSFVFDGSSYVNTGAILNS